MSFVHQAVLLNFDLSFSYYIFLTFLVLLFMVLLLSLVLASFYLERTSRKENWFSVLHTGSLGPGGLGG